jgi:hypothetical protein
LKKPGGVLLSNQFDVGFVLDDTRRINDQ